MAPFFATGPADLQVAAVSWAKLESCLDSDADYLFTAAHYPAYSGCKHGSVMSKTELPGLLKKYNAHGHLAGHDHCMQHIERDGIAHVVAGAGSDGWYGYSSISGAKWHISSDNHGSVKGGFAELQVTSSGVKIVYYDDKGSELHSSDSYAPRTPPAPTPPTPPTPTPPSPTPAGADTLLPGDANALQAGNHLVSASGSARLELQGSDGNLVLYDANGAAVWATGTGGHTQARLVLQSSDGNLVLYDGKTPLWSSGNHAGATRAVLHDDCSLVVINDSGDILWSLGKTCNSVSVV